MELGDNQNKPNMIKRFLICLLIATNGAVAFATDQVTFTRLAYDDGYYLYRTYATNPETPYATQIRPDVSGNPYVFEIILLNENVEKVYSFSIRIPEDHDYCYPLNFVDKGGSYISDILVTQHLFNDDDLYEVVLRGREDESRWIYNEKGEFLGEIPSEASRLYEYNGKMYFYAEYDKGTDGHTVGALYEINKGGNAVMTVAAENSKLTASPNPVKLDENVIITLPTELSSSTMVKVFSTDGVLLINKECTKGENKISIPAYRLASGINPVVVMDAEGNILSTGKIIRE